MAVAFAARASDEDVSPESRALLAIAADAGHSWRARAGALRALAHADRADPAALAALVHSAERAVLRRLALAALAATDAEGGHVGAAVGAALADDAPGVRREGLRTAAARPEQCTAAATAVVAALRDDVALNRVFAARAAVHLALAGLDLPDAAAGLATLLSDAEAARDAARALLLLQPPPAVLRTHRRQLDALTASRTAPEPAALILATWAGRDDDAWRTRLAAHAIEGAPAVRQAAQAALAWCAAPGRTTEVHVRQATGGPDAAVICAALRAPCADDAAGRVRARTAGPLLRHAAPLVRRLARVTTEAQ